MMNIATSALYQNPYHHPSSLSGTKNRLLLGYIEERQADQKQRDAKRKQEGRKQKERQRIRKTGN
jgi:hypothetical protein